jgi:hypothetical protein
VLERELVSNRKGSRAVSLSALPRSPTQKPRGMAKTRCHRFLVKPNGLAQAHVRGQTPARSCCHLRVDFPSSREIIFIHGLFQQPYRRFKLRSVGVDWIIEAWPRC